MNRLVAVPLGILSFALLAFFCIRIQAPQIEQDVMARSRDRLSENQLPTNGLSVDGRDVILRGVAGTPEVSDRAVSLVESVYGVRVARVEAQPVAGLRAEVTAQPQVTLAQTAQAKLDMLLQNKVVEFDPASARLTPIGRQVLDEVAAVLATVPATKCAISGHTDSIGLPEENQFLSDRRAIVTKEYLVSKGIPADRLTAKGYGAAKPAATNDTEEGRQRNRRIEFRLEGGN
jgi:outer membrane protein OmpA-like peptidoglycan-associated protein